MKTIHKYSIKPGIQQISMPRDAIPLTVQVQDGQPRLWAIVDPERDEVKRAFFTVGTGDPLPPELTLRYVATFQFEGGMLVFHTFEVLEVSK